MIGNAELLRAQHEEEELSGVWVHVLDGRPDRYTVRDAVESTQNSTRAQILVLPTDAIGGLDFVSVQGLEVHVSGEDQQRCMAVGRQCEKHADRTVVAAGEIFHDTGETQ